MLKQSSPNNHGSSLLEFTLALSLLLVILSALISEEKKLLGITAQLKKQKTLYTDLLQARELLKEKLLLNRDNEAISLESSLLSAPLFARCSREHNTAIQSNYYSCTLTYPNSPQTTFNKKITLWLP